MKKLPIIFIVLLFALPGWAATYYVANAGTAKGATACATFLAMAANIATPAKTVADMNTCQASLSDGDIIAFKRGDTWAEQLSNGHANITFTSYGVGELPKFTGGSFSARATAAGQTYDKVWLTVARVWGDNVDGTTIRRCLITDTKGGIGIYIQNNTTIENNVIANTRGGATISIATSGNAIVRNNIIIGSNTTPLSAGSGRTITYSNNHFFGAGPAPATTGLVCGGSGTCTDGGGNNVNQVDPKLTSYKYGPVRVAIMRDDAENIQLWSDDIDAVAAAGVTGYKETIAVQPWSVPPLTDGQVAILQQRYDQGHGVSLHNGSHTFFTIASPYNAFMVTTTNDGAKINIDIAGDAITLDSDGDGYDPGDVNDVRVTGLSNMSACELKMAIGCAGTCANNSVANPCTGKGWTINFSSSDIFGGLRLSSLQDTGGAQSVGAGYQVKLDRGTATNRFFVDEFANAKTALATRIGRTIRTNIMVGGYGGDDASTYLMNSGLFTSSRSINGANDLIYGGYLNSIDIYRVYSAPYNVFVTNPTTDEATTRKNTRAYYGWALVAGGIFTTYFHRATYITAQQVAWMASELYNLGAVFVTYDELADYIRGGHTCTNGTTTTTCTRTYTGDNYRLQSGSPAINAGVDVGLTTDADGKPISGKPDIGAYEYQETGAGLLMCQ